MVIFIVSVMACRITNGNIALGGTIPWAGFSDGLHGESQLSTSIHRTLLPDADTMYLPPTPPAVLSPHDGRLHL